MTNHRCWSLFSVGLWIFWSISLYGNAQELKKATAVPADHSAEAYVYEESSEHWNFENDGTGTREKRVRVRVQTDVGVERFGLLEFHYQKSVEDVDIDYVRVRKADGSVVPTPLDDLQDMPAAVTREAPFYSDLREKHLAVKGLSRGDVLEYQCHWRSTRPLVPGQFWMQSAFLRDEVILEQEIQVNVPRERAIKFKSTDLAPVITEEGQRRIYTWKRSNLEVRRRPRSELADLSIHGGFPAPDVQLSSFQSWEEIGRWYAGLQQDRIVPSADVRAKAAELTRNAVDDQAKIQAIYRYVSTEYRYIGIAFGIGRYQPHSAAEVLSNQYGDCKDKHTLLASLLAAAGIPAYAALINSSHVIDPDVPSPAQFDHVITAVPRGKELLWLDTTAEVGPLGYLMLVLRDKKALIVFPDQPASFQVTPANPPFPSSWTFKINAKLDESGTLEGKVDQTMRGDLEVIWRAVFRRLPRTNWKDAMQRFSYAAGFGGEVSEATASMPEATETPFHLSYIYRRKQYPDWENHRITVPLPAPFEPPFEEEGKLPQRLWLDAPGEYEFESKLELPNGYRPSLPPNKDLKEDFVEYHSTYGFEGNALVARYRIKVKVGELSGSAVNDYKTMAEKVMKEHSQYIFLSKQSQSPLQSLNDIRPRAWELPGSSDPKALQLEQEARAALDQHSMPATLDALQRAVVQDPKFTRDWVLLGQLRLLSAQPEAGIDALRRAVDVDRQEPLPYKFLALSLSSLGRRSEAIRVWQDYAKIAPEDQDAPANIGNLLLGGKRFADAVPYLETVVKLYPDNSSWRLALATAYLNIGQEEKASEAFVRAMGQEPSAEIQNTVSYALATANKRLDDAFHYAQSAVRREEEASRKVQLSKLVVDDLKTTLNLGAYWDTLGWVYYRQGNLKQAEGYLYAAWILRQDPAIGYHLAQVYEKQQRKQEATRMYRFVSSISVFNRGAEDQEAIATAKKQLETASPSPRKQVGRVLLMDDPGGEMSQERSVSLPKLVSKQASAEFFLSFAPDSKTQATIKAHVGVVRDAVVEDAVFVSGSDLLRSAGLILRQARFKVVFPEDSDGRLLRRGILACYSEGCTIVLIPPDSVRQVN